MTPLWVCLASGSAGYRSPEDPTGVLARPPPSPSDRASLALRHMGEGGPLPELEGRVGHADVRGGPPARRGAGPTPTLTPQSTTSANRGS